ncbi:hypothetical protein CWIS_16425 [Cellulomonas sp. A375-1]|nr:hypothetical protein CWIS_16425 [Cellulomonas sp. A375-1]
MRPAARPADRVLRIVSRGSCPAELVPRIVSRGDEDGGRDADVATPVGIDQDLTRPRSLRGAGRCPGPAA